MGARESVAQKGLPSCARQRKDAKTVLIGTDNPVFHAEGLGFRHSEIVFCMKNQFETQKTRKYVAHQHINTENVALGRRKTKVRGNKLVFLAQMNPVSARMAGQAAQAC